MRTWWLLLAVAASAVSWTYMHSILLPWESYVNAQHGVTGQMGDLYPRWVGTRELLLHGRNPYGSEVSHEIQMAFYGHPVEQNYDDPGAKIIDEQRFVYPVYVVLLLAPTIYVDFAHLQAWAPIFLSALTTISVWIWMQLLRWRIPPLTAGGVILFVLCSPQIAQGLRLRQFGLVVAFLLALACWCVTRNLHFLAGVALALSTIKPQMVGLCLLWLLLWATGEWRRRWSMAAGFGVTLAFLIVVGELLLPGWPRYFLEGLAAYRKYFPTTSPLRLLLGNGAGGALSVVLVAALVAYSWGKRRVEPNSPEFVETLALFFVATTIVLPLLTPFNQVLLVLPAMMLFRDWNVLPPLGRIVFSALVAWPWIASLALLVHPPQVESLSRFPLLPSAPVLLFPFMVAALMFSRQQRMA